MNINSFKAAPIGFKASYICASIENAKKYPGIFPLLKGTTPDTTIDSEQGITSIRNPDESIYKEKGIVTSFDYDTEMLAYKSKKLCEDKIPHIVVHASFEEHPDNKVKDKDKKTIDKDISTLTSSIEKDVILPKDRELKHLDEAELDGMRSIVHAAGKSGLIKS